MGFLDRLRSTNVFRPRPATDRPFGMPDIDDGDYNTLFREVGPVAAELSRQPQSNLIERGSLAPRRMPMVAGNTSSQKKNVVYRGTEGFSPMQRQFMADDAQRENQERQDARLTQNFMRQDELMRQKRMDDSINFDKELAGRKELSGIDLDKAVRLREVDRKAQAERDKFIADQRRQDIITRERAQGEEARKTLAAKPTTDKPLDEGRDFNNRVQQLMLDPRFSKHIIKDDATGTFKFSDDTTPEQAAFLREKLGVGEKKATETKPTGPASNDRVKVSKDGVVKTVPKRQLEAAGKQGWTAVK